MDSEKTYDSNDPNKGRKFGLPDWMVHNIGRLNVSTDFEQYACSPPQSEDFLSEYVGSPDCKTENLPSTESGVDTKVSAETLRNPGLNLQLSLEKYDCVPEQERTSSPCHASRSPISPKQFSILDILKNEDMACSSPDTTPCVTPEPSPIPRRKLSGVSSETVATNPKRWFYLGFPKEENKQKALSRSIYENVPMGKPKTMIGERQISDALDARNKEIKSNIADNSSSVKLAITNFDMNAVSPTSW